MAAATIISKSNKSLFFFFVASLLIFVSLMHIAHSSSSPEPGFPLLQHIDCGALCDVRCQLSSRPNLCKRACGTCCARCNCVPPGTAGSKEACPCYANMTTHGGRPKCP